MFEPKKQLESYTFRHFMETWNLKEREPKMRIEKSEMKTFGNVLKLIMRMISLDIEKRPTFEEIMSEKEKL